MLNREQYSSVRKIMILLGFISFIFQIISLLLYIQADYAIVWHQLLLFILSTCYLFGLLFFHPNHHRIIAIPLILSVLITTPIQISALQQFHSAISHSVVIHFFQIAYMYANFFIGLIVSIGIIYIFMKRSSYHFSDFFIVAFSIFFNLALSGVNLFNNLMQAAIVENGQIRLIFISNGISFISSLIVSAILLMYVFEAKRLSESDNVLSKTSQLPPRLKDKLKVLDDEYRKGKMTYHAYLEQKNLILDQEDIFDRRFN